MIPLTPKPNAKTGTFSNLVKQAKSKQKILDKMMADGLTEPVVRERTFKFDFPECDKLPPPVMPFIDVSFAYSGQKEDYLYANLEFGVDCDSRIALVRAPVFFSAPRLVWIETGLLNHVRGLVHSCYNPRCSS